MENLINWFEIPARDFSRAVSFYKAILGLDIKEAEMFGTKMGFFPTDGKNVSGAIVQGDDYKPSTQRNNRLFEWWKRFTDRFG